MILRRADLQDDPEYFDGGLLIFLPSHAVSANSKVFKEKGRLEGKKRVVVLKQEAILLSVLGIFSRSRKGDDLELLPPPPPFPDFDFPDDAKKEPYRLKSSSKKAAATSRKKESANDILRQATSASWQDDVHDPSKSGLGEASSSQDSWNFDDSSSSYYPFSDSQKEIEGAISTAKQPPQKEGFWRRLFIPKKRMPSPDNFTTSDFSPLDGPQPGIGEPKQEISETESVMKMVSDARDMVMNLDLSGAKDAYVNIMKSYRMMTEDEQKQVYEPIKELYDERKAAEGLHLK